MWFTSTRKELNLESAQVIAQGISAEGGLFVPREFPQIDGALLHRLIGMNYCERAETILAQYLTDFSAAELRRCVNGAYRGTFDRDAPAPLREIAPGMHMLELWHGPTCAFKDMALQLLPFLLTAAVEKTAPGRTSVILVATSGDTGKAALAGFAGVPGTEIVVFYPGDGVSAMQKRQMTTQAGNNVAVCGIEGNFDDAQSGVKAIFSDPVMHAELAAQNMAFSSANSINFGRLAPQVVYYVSAYCDLIAAGKIRAGEPINVAVPTGNFGNILAAVYAGRMGIPIRKFICASNRNNVLTDFLETGVYDRNRAFHTTESPSMDILISSNLERMLYLLYHGDASAVAARMDELKRTGKYAVSPAILAALQSQFAGGCCDDAGTRETIAALFHGNGYLCDPHTAVAAHVCKRYVETTGDRTPCVVVSTASPYKFAPAVLAAISGEPVPADDFAKLDRLSELSETPIPAPLAALKTEPVRHPDCVKKEDMAAFIRRALAR